MTILEVDLPDEIIDDLETIADEQAEATGEEVTPEDIIVQFLLEFGLGG